MVLALSMAEHYAKIDPSDVTIGSAFGDAEQ
jgi:hypothetical protein